MHILPKIPPSWELILQDTYTQHYMQQLDRFLSNCATFYPPTNMIYTALDLCAPDTVKVVILGQDPYHNVGQAMGLSFSVPVGMPIPPSLKNMYREIEESLHVLMPPHGDLTNWAKSGVLLLNAVLTVSPHAPASHKNQGWETFTDYIIKTLSEKYTNIVFILWGNYAVQKTALIDAHKHLILTSVHPSPLSAYRGFFGCRHFVQTNEYLIQHGKAPIVWDTL